MRRRLIAASALLLAAALLAGCASIPSAGKVQKGEVAAADAVPDLDILVDPPKVDGTQEEILDGFLTAALSPQNNYRAAYEFLTPEFADQWQADEGATIDVLADREFEQVSDTQRYMVATPAASLGDNGQYEVAVSATPIELKYSFEQIDGQWRISEAPPGIVIDTANFAQVFREYTLYFYDPAYRYLVPDSRWFAGRESAQTSVVQAILAGPADWLDPGVETAFPEGTELSPAAVPVTSRVAEVSLTGAAFDDAQAAQRMQLQLDESLVGSVRNVSRVSLSLNGVESDVGVPSPAPVRDPRVDPRPVVFDGESLGYLSTSGDGITPISGLSDQVVQAGATGAAIGPDAESAAILTPSGVSVVTAGEDPVLLDPRPGLITPAVDRAGIVWSVPADTPSDLVWFLPDGSNSGRVSVPWSATSIAAIQVSRDGTRMLALLGDGSSTYFLAAAIPRGADGLPGAELGPGTLRLAEADGVPLDVAWIDGRTVASLTRLPDNSTRLITQDLGGFAITRAGPADGVMIDAGNSARDVRALDAAGDLLVQNGVGWQIRASGIRFTAAQLPG